jgi:hypothetical protein
MSENRMYELFNLGGRPFSAGSPGYLLHTVCNSSLPCGGGDHGYSFFRQRQDYLEILGLLPHLFPPMRSDCAEMAALRQAAEEVAARYAQGELSSAQALQSLNAALEPTNTAILSMGGMEEFCSGSEPVYGQFRWLARQDPEEYMGDLPESSENVPPFTPQETEIFIEWMNAGGGGLNADFFLAETEEEE